jgi:hypothetical protein
VRPSTSTITTRQSRPRAAQAVMRKTEARTGSNGIGGGNVVAVCLIQIKLNIRCRV